VSARLLPLAFAAGIGAALAPASAIAATDEVRRTNAVVYGTAPVQAPSAGSARLLLDLYQPARRSSRPRPVVIVIHGGGFVGGIRSDPNATRVSRALAQRGVVVASIDYRLRDQRPVLSRRIAPLARAFPQGPLATAVVAAADDTLTAIDYLRSRAKRFNIDMRRLGLVGSSAGAITADHVAYVLDDYGIARPPIRFVASLWGGIYAQAPAGRTGGGAGMLERGDAPLFAVHGDADQLVPVGLSDALVARARAVGVRTEYHRVPGGTHAYPGTQFFTRKVTRSQTAFGRLLRFAEQELKPRGRG
jgi:acetyl esterase/lipase